MSVPNPKMLELDRLWKTYDTPKGPAVIVKDFNLRLKEGEFATLIGHARSDSKSRVDRLPGSAHGTEATTTPHAAALVMPAAPPSASGASEHTRTWTHPDLEHGFGTRRRIRDPRILCNRAFDVRQSGEWAFAQAFFVIHFFGRKTEYAGTPLTLTKPTARRRTDIHENSNSAIFCNMEDSGP